MTPRPDSSDSKPTHRISRQHVANLERFKFLHKNVLNKEASNIVSPSQVVDALKQLAEFLIWEDKNNGDAIFDYFCEENMMDYMTGVLCRSSSRPIRIQLVQTISMLIHNITNERTLYYLLSNNYINGLIMVPEMYAGGDVTSWTISLLKTLSSILNKSTIKFFFLQKNDVFPLLDKSMTFLNNNDSMKRAHVMTIILNIFKVKDGDVIRYIINKSKILLHLVLYLKYCWYRLNKYVNKHKRLEENILIECDDVLCFIEELMDLEIKPINQKLIFYIYNTCFIPLVKKVFKRSTIDLTLLDRLKKPDRIDSDYFNSLYYHLSNTVGLTNLYINNKTNLYNTFSENGSTNEQLLNPHTDKEMPQTEDQTEHQSAPQSGPQSEVDPTGGQGGPENSSSPPATELDQGDWTEPENAASEAANTLDNEPEPAKKEVGEPEAPPYFPHQGEDLQDMFDPRREKPETRALINNVVYYIIVNILINCKRPELSKPLILLFFSPIVPRELLLQLADDTTASMATTPMETPVSNQNTRDSNPSTDGTQEHDNDLFESEITYDIDRRNQNAYRTLLRFLRFYDEATNGVVAPEHGATHHEFQEEGGFNGTTADEEMVDEPMEGVEHSKMTWESNDVDTPEAYESPTPGEGVLSPEVVDAREGPDLATTECDASGERGQKSDSRNLEPETPFEDEYVVNVVMGLFIYDGLSGLNDSDAKMLMLLKLLLHLQSRLANVPVSARSEEFSPNSASNGDTRAFAQSEDDEMLPVRSLLTNNNIYLQLFNAICSNVTNYKLNVVVVKLFNTLLHRYLTRLKGSEGPFGTPKRATSLRYSAEGPTTPTEAHDSDRFHSGLPEKNQTEDLMDEIRFHLDITYNIIRLYVLNSIESTTLLYLSVFYEEWVKYVKLYHTSVHNLIHYNDVLPLDVTPPGPSMLPSKGRPSPEGRGKPPRGEQVPKERLIRRIFSRSSRNFNSTELPEGSFERVQDDRQAHSPLNVFKRYIQILLLFKELYNTINRGNSTSLNGTVHLKTIREALNYLYEACPLFYNRLELLHIHDKQIKLGNIISLDRNARLFRCTIRNNKEQRNRIYVVNDVFFVLAKVKHGYTESRGEGSKELDSMLRNLSLADHEPDDAHNGPDKADAEKPPQREHKDPHSFLEITCIHFLWNCLIKKVDRSANKFNVLISWHPNYKSLNPAHYYNNSQNKWNDPITPVVSEFDVVFSSSYDLNAALKLHNHNKKNLSNTCLLSLQDYLYNSV